MNQLMGQTAGFELGPTVRPTTEGIWTWGAPLSDGAGLNVLLLDTEGLSAPGNDADYDAKVTNFYFVSLFLCKQSLNCWPLLL